ncbi:MAG TPA: serine hydroxymethyltransferase [Candidatus Kaiserbacteria bacterium]|nr:serine hydroxymethyltransferase [Candidatus Kaiserbacteria bacterium]
MYDFLKREDMDVYTAVVGEDGREENGLELIPSENYVSHAVRDALASTLTNKYAEGYPEKRYYGGQDFTDMVETTAIERAKKLFNAEYANVQPLGGANANIAMYFALLEPGDTVLGMELSHGGHLTHGHPVTYLTKIFNFAHYQMKDVETGDIDYDEMRRIANEVKPKILLAGFSAYPRELDYAKFVEIAKESGALAVMDIAHIAGLIAGGAVKNPFDYGFDLLTTTTHKTLRGPRGGMILTRNSAELARKIDKSVFPGFQGGPHMNNIAAKAVAFGEALRPSFKTYSLQVIKNAKAMAHVFAEHGAKMVAGGTENHLILLDAWKSFGVSGADAEALLDKAGITLNKNIIPNDTRKPMDPSGIRFGTPALTTRGFTEDDVTLVANLMIDILTKKDSVENVRKTVQKMATAHPIPESFV